MALSLYLARRQELLDEITQTANPRHSVHIRGCRGAGKTTLLHQLGEILDSQQKKVYFLNNSSIFRRESALDFFDESVQTDEEVVVLVDETQNNVEPEVFTTLLKNTSNHKITTIGAGAPSLKTLSSSFKSSITTSRLFLSSDEMLQTEGGIGFFTRSVQNVLQTEHIVALLKQIRHGHIYLVPRITEGGETSNQAIKLFQSPASDLSLERR